MPFNYNPNMRHHSQLPLPMHQSPNGGGPDHTRPGGVNTHENQGPFRQPTGLPQQTVPQQQQGWHGGGYDYIQARMNNFRGGPSGIATQPPISPGAQGGPTGIMQQGQPRTAPPAQLGITPATNPAFQAPPPVQAGPMPQFYASDTPYAYTGNDGYGWRG